MKKKVLPVTDMLVIVVSRVSGRVIGILRKIYQTVTVLYTTLAASRPRRKM
jgi:hypothetical protein